VITDKQLEVLRHTLGYNYSPRRERNAFVTSADSDDFVHCVMLVSMGYMEDRGTSRVYGGHCFAATEAGHTLVKAEEPPLKLTRSQRRYRDWLNADTGLSFREWLGIDNKRAAL
jgi:hypothetical protein